MEKGRDMAKIDVIDLSGKKVESIELNDDVFATEVNGPLVWEAVRHHRAKKRAGTASTQGRGEVRGGGRKPWRQKGTGRARVGSIRTPLWKGGGVTHGPKPRDYGYRFPKKMRKGALRSILSHRMSDNRLKVLDNLTPEDMKTKAFLAKAKELGIENAVFVDARSNENLWRATSNIPTMLLLDHFALNPYDLLRYKNIVFSKAAIEQVNEALKP
jgi:large subunit ribosomal protein L4